MSPDTMDRLTRSLSSGMSRRAALRGAGGGAFAVVVATAAGYDVTHASAHQATPAEAETTPSAGFTLHIDAKLHFPGDPELIAHHYCKTVAGGLIECLLFDSDEADARLVGVEVIVDAETYNSFDATERAMWHYHKDEIPKVSATLPDLSPEEAAEVVATIEETYGKLYILWDPSQSDLPIGQPSVTMLM